MKYSDIEQISGSTDDDLIEAGLKLLPVIGSTLYAAISELGQAYGLTPTQVKVLLHLGVRGQMTVGEIAGALAISMPATSELVDRLVDAGHVERAMDLTDRRRVVISATPESRQIGARLHDLRRSQLRHALMQFAPEERPLFVRSLEALVAGLTDCSGPDMPDRAATRAWSPGAAETPRRSRARSTAREQ